MTPPQSPTVPRPHYPVLVSVALYSALLAGYVGGFHGDLSALVCVGSEWAGRPPFEAVHTSGGEGGYDGQFYYAIARNPWRRQGPRIYAHDKAAFRHLRILYPALAWALSGGGHPYLLLWVLPAVNVLAAAGLTYLGARTARHFGMSAWWGLVLPLAVNAGLPMLRDLTDPLATFAVTGLLVGWLLEWPWWSLTLWAAAAVFAREQNVAVVGITLGVALWGRRFGTAAGMGAVLALWGGWVCLLRLAYGQWPLMEGGVLGAPLAGLLHCWVRPSGFGSLPARAFHVAYMAAFTAQILLCFSLAAGKGDRLVSGVGLLGAVFALLAAWSFTYIDRWSYARVFVWVPLGVWLNSIRARRCWPLLTTLPSALFPLLIIVWQWRS